MARQKWPRLRWFTHRPKYLIATCSKPWKKPWKKPKGFYADIWDPLARVFDAWGLDRCLWGTDWTRTFAVVNYEQAVEPFRLTDRLSESERAMLMGGACERAYGWAPEKR